MTLEEKVGQMMCIWQGKQHITDAQGRFDPARAPQWFRSGLAGSSGRVVDTRRASRPSSPTPSSAG